MSIPKKIHYVWVGPAQPSADIQRCMKTWKRYLPDYEIICWNEKNFDFSSSPFAMQAYERKKWAYVSDYIRAAVIYEYGGIYLDTDVLVLDDLTQFLGHRAFVGFENSIYPFTAVFGAEKHHPFVADMLSYYDGKSFSFDVGDQFAGVNSKSVSELLINSYGCVADNSRQTLREGIEVYPDNILCNPSGQSSTIHVFTGTWLEGMGGMKKKLVKAIRLRLTSKRRAALYDKIIRKGRC